MENIRHGVSSVTADEQNRTEPLFLV